MTEKGQEGGREVSPTEWRRKNKRREERREEGCDTRRREMREPSGITRGQQEGLVSCEPVLNRRSTRTHPGRKWKAVGSVDRWLGNTGCRYPLSGSRPVLSYPVPRLVPFPLPTGGSSPDCRLHPPISYFVASVSE